MMRRIKVFFIILLGLIVIFVLHIFVSTGFFREIENKFDGEILEKIALPGAEDIMVSLTDSFAIISSTDRRGIQSESDRRDGLYFMDLRNNN